MKNLRKVGALVLAVVMMVGMSSVALGDGAQQNFNLDPDVHAPAIVNENGLSEVSFNVYLTPNDPTYKVPNVKFSYEVWSGGVSGANTAGLPKNAGPMEGVNNQASVDANGHKIYECQIAANTAINAKSSSSSTTDDSVCGQVVIGIDSTKFSSAGIYTYRVVQQALTAAQRDMIVRNQYGNGDMVVRYLDLFVTGEAGSLKVTGAVLYSDGDVRPAYVRYSNDLNKMIGYYPNKVDGFYNTWTGYNVRITKTLAGGFTSSYDFFPFNVKLQQASYEDASANTNSLKIGIVARDGTLNGGDSVYNINSYAESLYRQARIENDGGALEGHGFYGYISLSSDKTTATETVTVSGVFADQHDGTEKGIHLAGGGYITLKGLTYGMLVGVYENIKTNDGYKISASVANMTTNTATVGNPTTPSQSTITQETEYTIVDNVKGNNTGLIDYVNYRDTISPTGVILRFAPYLLILGAGIFLLIVARKRRHAEEE